jgi:hypothetical protein
MAESAGEVRFDPAVPKLLNPTPSVLVGRTLLVEPPYCPAVLNDLARRTSALCVWGNVSDEEVGSGEVESLSSESDSTGVPGC